MRTAFAGASLAESVSGRAKSALVFPLGNLFGSLVAEESAAT